MRTNNTRSTVATLLTRPGMSHTVLLTSFRRDGQEVSTPVGMRSADDRLHFMTPASSGKVKRIAHNPHVALALCTFGGKALGPTSVGMARRLTGIEATRARKVICAGLAGWIVNAIFAVRYPGDKTAVYEVVLQPASHDKTGQGSAEDAEYYAHEAHEIASEAQK